MRSHPIRLALLGATTLWLCAQQKDETFRVDVRLVRMLVTVKNAKGQAVGELTKQDFSVTDNGVEQELTVFERQSTQPLSVALLYDTSLSTISDSKYKKNSVQKFVRGLIKEGNPSDNAALYSFNDSVTLQVGFSRNISRLQRAVGGLGADGGTSLYDAVYLAARDLERRDGRRVMIAVSDGGDTSSRVDFHQAIEALHRANVVFYSILVIPIEAQPGRNLGGENALSTLSTWTGGKVFFPTAGAALDRTFEDILKDLRTQYMLGYYPRNLPYSKERYHRVQVTVNRPDVVVYARNGYFDEAKADDASQSKGPKLRPEIP